jgi:hypothetical protein
MQTLILEPKNKKELEVIKTIADVLQIAYKESGKIRYNAAFEAKMKKSMKQVSERKVTRIKTADLWK